MAAPQHAQQGAVPGSMQRCQGAPAAKRSCAVSCPAQHRWVHYAAHADGGQLASWQARPCTNMASTAHMKMSLLNSALLSHWICQQAMQSTAWPRCRRQRQHSSCAWQSGKHCRHAAAAMRRSLRSRQWPSFSTGMHEAERLASSVTALKSCSLVVLV